LYHITSGLVLVGLAGFFQMMALAVRIPWLAGNRGGGDWVGAAILGIMVIVGLCRATMAIYSLLGKLLRRVIQKADDLVLEVN